MHEHYHTVDDVDYIRERVEEGMFGAFVGGDFAGFIGAHDERSIGLLYVLPDYRRLGLAFALEAVMTNHLLSIGRLPFCQVQAAERAFVRAPAEARLYDLRSADLLAGTVGIFYFF